MLTTVRGWLPVGLTLSESDWARRHRAIAALAWVHAALLPVYGIDQGQPAVHAVAESAVVAVLAAAAGRTSLSRTARSIMSTSALVTSSALLVHFSGGLIEMHFHFFVIVAVISLYQSWLPFLAALGFVVVHHGVAGQLMPDAVYNHPSAVGNAWLWALVHGVFILAESAACLVAWRLNESALAGERRAREDMARAHRDLANAQAIARVGSWDWQVSDGSVSWSDEMYALCGRRREDFVPTVESFLDHVVEEDRGRVSSLISTAASSGAALDFECVIARPDGVRRTLHALGESATDPGGARRLVGTCQDITDRKALEAEVQHRTFHDSLTGLPNRALFLDRLEHAMTVAGRTGAPLALLYLDVDDFKTVNDNLGHAVGDELLVQFGERLRGSIRAADTLARLGGDEFVLLLEGTSTDGAVELAERLLQSLQDPLDLGSGRRVCRASVGIARAEADDEPGDLLRRADIAMYAAKRQGKHAYRVFSEAMHSSLAARMELETELAEAIEQEQLVVHYQPLVDLGTGRVQGVEALVRWDHPTRGVLPPSEFIPVAEETGLIGPLGEWVLRRAVTDVRLLQDAVQRELYVSVNVSAAQLATDIVTTVGSALADAGLAPEDLLLEITESSLVGDDVVGKLATLRATGVQVAIDDFGTGYSSLSYLKDLPIDLLKIDRSFVRDLVSSTDSSALTLSIIHLAGLFGLRIVGEGVETAEQAEALRGLGCHVGQGYHYSRPIDLASLTHTLQASASIPTQRSEPVHAERAAVARRGG